MDGTRFAAAAAQCDNGLVEPSETCDQGSFEGVSLNGDTCCDASCQLVDPDGDLSCSRYDNCPDVTNLDQADTDFDGVGDACDPDQGAPDSLLIERVRVHYSDPTRATLSVKASYPGSADPPWLIHVDSVLCNGLVLSIHSRGTYQELYRNLVCKVRPGKSVCKSEVDGLRLLVKTRQRPGSDVRFDLVLKHADFCSPGAMPPVRLTLVHAGGSRTGAATRCEIRATATGNVYKTTCTP
jgi:hypothetical protein